MKKILVVDDDAELRTTISEILREKGYDVDISSSGREALERSAGEGFDVVLLDLIMPGMDGMEVLKELKKARPGTRVIMITAFATIENAVDAVKKGASDYLAKPFKTNELLVTVSRVLEEAKFDEGMKKLNIDHALSSLSNPIRRSVIQMLSSRDGMRLMEITRELGMEDHTKVIFHLRTLKEAGIIDQNKDKSYFLTKEGKKAVELIRMLDSHFLSS